MKRLKERLLALLSNVESTTSSVDERMSDYFHHHHQQHDLSADAQPTRHANRGM